MQMPSGGGVHSIIFAPPRRYIFPPPLTDGLGLVLLAVPAPAVVLLAVLWFELVLGSVKRLHGGRRRRRAESDLHGHARLLGHRFLRRLARRQGILLGQWGAGRNARLIGWSLEGSAITVAPPRAGKGATIALNLLSPDRPSP